MSITVTVEIIQGRVLNFLCVCVGGYILLSLPREPGMCVPLTDQVLCFQSKCDCLSQGLGGFCEVVEKEGFIGLWGGVEHVTMRTLYLYWTILLTEFSNTHACTFACAHTHTHTYTQ